MPPELLCDQSRRMRGCRAPALHLLEFLLQQKEFLFTPPGCASPRPIPRLSLLLNYPSSPSCASALRSYGGSKMSFAPCISAALGEPRPEPTAHKALMALSALEELKFLQGSWFSRGTDGSRPWEEPPKRVRVYELWVWDGKRDKPRAEGAAGRDQAQRTLSGAG